MRRDLVLLVVLCLALAVAATVQATDELKALKDDLKTLKDDHRKNLRISIEMLNLSPEHYISTVVSEYVTSEAMFIRGTEKMFECETDTCRREAFASVQRDLPHVIASLEAVDDVYWDLRLGKTVPSAEMRALWDEFFDMDHSEFIADMEKLKLALPLDLESENPQTVTDSTPSRNSGPPAAATRSVTYDQQWVNGTNFLIGTAGPVQVWVAMFKGKTHTRSCTLSTTHQPRSHLHPSPLTLKHTRNEDARSSASPTTPSALRST